QGELGPGLSRSRAASDRNPLRARGLDQGGGREAGLQLALHSARREAQAGALRWWVILPLGLESRVRPTPADHRLGSRELLRLVRGPAPEPHQDTERERA